MNHFATTVSIFCYYQRLLIFATSIICFSCLFCYNHILILLELKTFIATSTHGGVAQRRQWLFLFLLHPFRIFATTGGAICYHRSFCYYQSSGKHQEFLLPLFVFVLFLLEPS